MLANKSAVALSLLVLTTVLGSSPQAAAQSESPATSQPATVPANTQPAPAQPGTAQSSSPSATASRSHPRGFYRRQTIDDRVKTFAKALDLNDRQQAGVKAVLERQQAEARQIQFDSNLSGQERIGRFRALQEDTVQRIRALLNDEQKKKYDPTNHNAQNAGSSDSYVNQWMKYHEPSEQPTASPKK